MFMAASVLNIIQSIKPIRGKKMAESGVSLQYLYFSTYLKNDHLVPSAKEWFFLCRPGPPSTAGSGATARSGHNAERGTGAGAAARSSAGSGGRGPAAASRLLPVGPGTGRSVLLRRTASTARSAASAAASAAATTSAATAAAGRR